MNKKTIIQLVVILAGFIGSAFVLYNGLFKNRSEPPSQPAIISNLSEGEFQTGEIATDKILPYGNELDFLILQKNRQEYGIIKYPKLDPEWEVGISENQLVKPPPKKASIE